MLTNLFKILPEYEAKLLGFRSSSGVMGNLLTFFPIFDSYELEKRGKNTAYAFIFEKELGKEFNEYCLKE